MQANQLGPCSCCRFPALRRRFKVGDDDGEMVEAYIGGLGLAPRRVNAHFDLEPVQTGPPHCPAGVGTEPWNRETSASGVETWA